MNEDNLEKKLTDAYDKMMERLNNFLDEAEQQAVPTLQRNLDKAKQQRLNYVNLLKKKLK